MAPGFAAGEHPNGVELPSGAAAGGFAALAAHEVKRAWGQGVGGEEGAEGAAQGLEIASELLAEAGGFAAHECLSVVVSQSVSIYSITDTDCQQKIQSNVKKFEGSQGLPPDRQVLKGRPVRETHAKNSLSKMTYRPF